MDPITTALLAALATGAVTGATETSKNAISDAYAGIKALITRKFGEQQGITTAIEEVEQAPEETYPQSMLARRLQAAGATTDQELLAAAQDLQTKVVQFQGAVSTPHASGAGSVATGGAGHVATSGSMVVGGPYTGGHQLTGDITAGNITGTGIALGHSASAQVYQHSGTTATELAQLFAPIYEHIVTLPKKAQVKEELTAIVQKVQREAATGEEADKALLQGWLHGIAIMAPDMLDLVTNALLNPVADVANTVKTIVEQVQQERHCP